MRESALPRDAGLTVEAASFLACVATILEIDVDALPRPRRDEDVATGWTVTRWLGGLGVGLVAVAEPATFSWPGPWIARLEAGAERRAVVMFGVPSDVVWDPARGEGGLGEARIADGYLLAAADIALARPAPATAPAAAGRLEAICIAAGAGEPVHHPERARGLAGRGLEGDRHVSGRGTFPSGPPGSALTLIEAEVCESFDPPLTPDVHRRNLVTRGIDLGALVGHDFLVGTLRCRGMRLCEPCAVLQRYAQRPVLRALVHRGGLRADILEDGVIAVGDEVRSLSLPAG